MQFKFKILFLKICLKYHLKFLPVLQSKRFGQILMCEDVDASLFILMVLENILKMNRLEIFVLFRYLSYNTFVSCTATCIILFNNLCTCTVKLEFIICVISPYKFSSCLSFTWKNWLFEKWFILIKIVCKEFNNYTLRIEQSGFKPWLGHCVVFLGKTLYSHSASLHPGV